MIDDIVFIVDDDPGICDSLRLLLEITGFKALSFGSAEAFLADSSIKQGCLITDVHMPGMSGLDLLEEVASRQFNLAVIVMTGQADIPLAVRAMKAGAIDFLEKPFDGMRLTESVRRALELGKTPPSPKEEGRTARKLLTYLSSRERLVLDRLVEGHPHKAVAEDLGISPRTVEVHRAHIMLKMYASNLADLVRAVMVAQNI
jgi:two-component system response regulator FixJ